MDSVLTVLLAGGKGTRLDPLTRDRAKPAVPFAGMYRIVDFALSNCINSRLFNILVLTQYKSLSLEHHIAQGWGRFFHPEFGQWLTVASPQQRVGDDWYLGTADAVYQNLYSVEKSGAEHVLVLAADHVYKMDYRRMLAFHRGARRPGHGRHAQGPGGRGGRAVRGGRGGRRRPGDRVPGEAGPPDPGPGGRGALPGVDGDLRVHRPVPGRRAAAERRGAGPRARLRAPHPAPAHGPGAGPGVHLLRPGDGGARVLAGRRDGGRVLPGEHGPAGRPAGAGPVRPGVAGLQLPAELPAAPGGGRPGAGRAARPAARGTTSSRTGRCPTGGCGGRWSGSTAGSRPGRWSRTASCSTGWSVGPGAEVRRAILDKGVRVLPGARVGVDPEEDRARGFVVSEGGVTCVPKGAVVEAGG